MVKKYGLYLLRWQLSTLTLAPVMIFMAGINPWIAVIVGNLVGGLIFFWIDRWIFKQAITSPYWEVVELIECVDCGNEKRGYRLLKTKNYDKSGQEPEFRCEKCSLIKTEALRKKGIEI